MWLRMVPTGLGMSTRTTFGDQTGTAHTLYFTLHLAGQDSLKLETGEVFQNPAYASVRGNKRNEIAAHLNVRPASDERDPSHTNNMKYFEAVTGDDYGSPPSIHFDVSTPAGDYSLLLNNIRGGITPSLVTVGLRHNLRDKGSPLTYDYAPDGSMMIWRNATEQNRASISKASSFTIECSAQMTPMTRMQLRQRPKHQSMQPPVRLWPSSPIWKRLLRRATA